MSLRRTSVLAVVSILVLVAPGPSGPAGPAGAVEGPAPGSVGIDVVLTPSADGSGLAVTPSLVGSDGSDGGPAEGGGAVRWDLSGLDRASYRSDLLRVEVLSVDGPGRLTVHTPAAHGRRARVLDGVAPSVGHPVSMVLQVGRTTGQDWAFDRPGPHAVDVRVSIPSSGGGTAVAATRLVLGGDDPGVPPRAPEVSTAGAPRAGGRVVIAEGHVDVGPRVVDGRWRVQMKDDTVTPPAWRDLGDVVLHARDTARIELPDRPAYAFLGAPGTPYHLLPQTQQPGIVWPGWNSQDPSVVAAVPGSVTWRLGSVDGPGRFALFSTDSFGDIEVLFDSNRSMPQELEIARNSHVHGSWAFGAPGVYRIPVEMRATLADGSPVSDTRTLTIAVGDGTDPARVPAEDPGGAGSAVPSGVGSDEGAPGISITTDLGGGEDGDGGGGGGSGSGGGGVGGGPLAQTGSAVGRVLPWASLLLGLGLVLRLTSRRRLHKNENHS